MKSFATTSVKRSLVPLILIAFGGLAHAQTSYQWDGGAAGSNASMFGGTLTNWNPDLTSTSDYTGNNFTVATRTNASTTNRVSTTGGVGNTLTLSGNVTIRSLSFDNTAGYFPTTFLRINSNSSGSTSRTLTFNTASIDFLSVRGGFDIADAGNYVGTVVFSGNSGDNTTNKGTTAISLSYTGQSNINVVNAGDALYLGSLSSLGDPVDGANVTISGPGGIAKTGAGTLYLRGSNTFTGGLTISNGIVSVAAAGSLGSAVSANTSAVILNGGTLQFTGGTDPSSGNRGFRVGASGGTFDILADVTTTLSGKIRDYNSETGTLTKTGDGTLVLNGTSSFTGGTTVSAGTLQGDSTSLTGFIANNAAVVFSQATAGEFSGSMSGTGAFTKSGAGTLTLSGTLASSGASSITSGQLTLAHGTLGGSSLTVSSGATLAGAGTISAPTTLAAGATLASTSLTFDSSLDLSAVAGTGAHSLLFTLTAPGTSDTASINGVLSIGSHALTLDDFSLNTSALSGPGIYTLFQSTHAISGLLGDAGNLTASFDGYTGTLGFNGDSTALQLTVSAIPEPSTYALLLAAATGLAVFARRRRAMRTGKHRV